MVEHPEALVFKRCLVGGEEEEIMLMFGGLWERASWLVAQAYLLVEVATLQTWLAPTTKGRTAEVRQLDGHQSGLKLNMELLKCAGAVLAVASSPSSLSRIQKPPGTQSFHTNSMELLAESRPSASKSLFNIQIETISFFFYFNHQNNVFPQCMFYSVLIWSLPGLPSLISNAL